MPTDSDIAVKLLEQKIKMIYGLLAEHTVDEALCILENVKIQLGELEIRQQERAETPKTIKALEAEAEATLTA